MKKLGLLIIGVILAIAVLAQEDHEKTISRVDKLLDKQLKNENIHNLFLTLYSPSADFEWHTAKGKFKDGEVVTTEHPFYTASVGKTFTATAIGLLVDQGLIGFEDRIAQYLPASMIEDLHILNGINYKDSITVTHLLQHTSGLPDYFGEETLDGSPSMFDLIMMKPNHLWEPAELITFAKDHFYPSFAPGHGYSYTDTEYVLLGIIIEKVSGIRLHEFFNQHLFRPLEMDQTYLNTRSEPNKPSLKMAEMYADDYEISQLRSLSADWAGGAIVSTGKDLIKFQMALMNGELVSKETLTTMQSWTYETKGMEYGYGLRKIDFKELSPVLPNWTVIGHSGLNGTSMYYCPELDIYLAGTLNQLSASKDAVILMVKVLMLCKKI
ncbi:CubicO group peptidase, beta-lactamase class C family [Cyclobacterium xiamenense]|uniref:CubicO group peptidase, beta-lactamase class C family n=1 Tax=Cyclobacterium xiamenense TaxID=1297121 RepID=A0A1H6UIE2_9BACT|nr:serine hydrolase domain-containing protein [Cyclobacterium xiamenense]SEI89577.1 CubicO group peptidase, beta-lactamase class C family [Cyclobacterium xiamenense]